MKKNRTWEPITIELTFKQPNLELEFYNVADYAHLGEWAFKTALSTATCSALRHEINSSGITILFINKFEDADLLPTHHTK